MTSGGFFLLVFVENVASVVDFRLGRLENIAPVYKSKLRKRVDFYFGPGGPQEAWVTSNVFCLFFGDPFRVMCYRQPLRVSQNQCQAMLNSAEQCNPRSFCCICYLSVLCIICGTKSLR